MTWNLFNNRMSIKGTYFLQTSIAIQSPTKWPSGVVVESLVHNQDVLGLNPRLGEDKMGLFINAVTPAHQTKHRYRSKLRVCDLTIPTGVEGWESYPPACVSESAYVYCVLPLRDQQWSTLHREE